MHEAAERLVINSTQHRWRVSLDGNTLDIQAMQQQFGLPVVAIERDGKQHSFFGHDSLEECETSQSVHNAASKLVSQFSTCMTVAHSDYQPVRLGPYIQELHPDGTQKGMHIFVTLEGMTIRTAMGVAAIGGVAGYMPRPLPQRIHFLKQSNPAFSDAARLFAVAEKDFRLLYIVLEYIRDGIGGEHGSKATRWSRLEAKRWATADELHAFRNTANDVYRHKPRPTPNEMTPEAARELIRRLLVRWADEAMPT